jgi:VWFA-related protein
MMKSVYSLWFKLNFSCLLLLLVGPFFVVPAVSAAAQETSTVSAVVTAVPKKGEDVTPVPKQAITVYENRKQQNLSSWVPLTGSRAGLQLVILLDDSSRSTLGLQLKDLSDFVSGLPPATQIAIGYMRNGSAVMVQNFTTNHAQAAQAFRLPAGGAGINGSPYFCLSDLVKRWPGSPGNLRREVIMVTDGVDRYSGRRFDPEDPYVKAAVTDAQKAGVIVYSIYYRGIGRLDRSFVATDGGQNYLTQVSGDTGGKVYLEGFGNPVSFAPFLSDIQRKLQNQYELSFESTAKPGLQQLKVKTNQPNTNILFPAQVPVGRITAPQ